MGKDDRIEIPYTEAGRRCVEVLLNLGMKQLQRAREAAQAAIDEIISGAEKVDERARKNGKYTAVFASPHGERTRVIYDYRTKNIELEEVAA